MLEWVGWSLSNDKISGVLTKNRAGIMAKLAMKRAKNINVAVKGLWKEKNELFEIIFY